MSDLARNKANVIAFYKLMLNDCESRDAVVLRRRRVHPAQFACRHTGKDGFVDYFERMARDWPGKRVEIRRAFAEGDPVVLHCFPQWPGDHDYGGIDIFRVDAEGRIVEHWDVRQVIPKSAANPNGMF